VKVRKKYKTVEKRTKLIGFFVVIFVLAMSFSYVRLHRKSQKLQKEQEKVEAQIQKEKERKKELKEKKEYIKTREFIEKMATEKFGLLYPGEYIMKADE
jgi:cell division protein DivIC